MLNPKSGLQKRFTSALLDSRPFPHVSSGKFRPSEASATIQTPFGLLTKGSCKRKTWFRLKDVPKTSDQILPHQMQRMNVGKYVENAIIETCKREGLYVANNVPFQVTMDGIEIAGELDAVLRTEPCGTERYIAEIKSMYGYYAQKSIFGKFIGSGKEPGVPKDSYLMQIGLYLNHFSRLPKDSPYYISFGAIFVCDRGDGHFGVFDVWLEEEVVVINDDETLARHKIYYSSDDMGVPRTAAPFSIEDILSSYRTVKDALSGETPPEKDYTLQYTKEQVETYHEAGLISASAYKKWSASHGPRGKGKEQLGDWQCSYCDWAAHCHQLKE